MTRRAFVILGASVMACNSPPAPTSASAPASASTSAPAPASAAALASASAPASASASASAPKLPKGKCAQDSDCRLASSYCTDAPCACLVLGKDDTDPKCSGGTVKCFADPCMKKAARCDSGKCALTPAGPNATDK